MAGFNKGDKVVCVDDAGTMYFYPNLTKGKIYTIIGPSGQEEVAWVMDDKDAKKAFMSRRFKLSLYITTISVLRSVKHGKV